MNPRGHPDLHPGAHVFTSRGPLAVCMACRIAIRPGGLSPAAAVPGEGGLISFQPTARQLQKGYGA